MNYRSCLGFILLISFVACGSDSDESGGSSTTSSSTSSTTGSGGNDTTTDGSGGSQTTSDGGGGSSNDAPQPPVITSLMSMDGALHIAWENVTPDCDSIVFERNFNDSDYETAFTVSGSATDYHDMEASETGTYCYQARCIKDDVASEYSDEECGSP